MDLKFAERCEQIFQTVMKDGVRKTAPDGKRERNGSYVSGWRSTTTTATLEEGPYTIRACQVELHTFHPNVDTKGTQISLEFVSGENVVLRAERKGAETSKYFSGPEETPRGSEVIEATPWEIKMGEASAQFLLAG